MDKTDIKKLKKRYLLWLYKTTKETLDKIERKFTQLEIDKFLLKELKKVNFPSGIKKFIGGFERYVQSKEKDSLAHKYDNNSLKPGYEFLLLKLKAVEKAIVEKLGRAALTKIEALYEKEMNERILKSSERK